MATRTILIEAAQFADLCDGSKTFEIRPDDGYTIGDILWYIEGNQPDGDWLPTGRTALRRVTHILRGTDWLPRGFVVMALVDAYGLNYQAYVESQKPVQRKRW